MQQRKWKKRRGRLLRKEKKGVEETEEKDAGVEHTEEENEKDKAEGCGGERGGEKEGRERK